MLMQNSEQVNETVQITALEQKQKTFSVKVCAFKDNAYVSTKKCVLKYIQFQVKTI